MNTPAGETIIQLENISVRLPTKPHRLLIHGLSLKVQLNRPLLITGPSGVGKTALLRVLADHWPASSACPHQPSLSRFYRTSHSLKSTHPQAPIAYVPQQLLLPTSTNSGDSSTGDSAVWPIFLQLMKHGEGVFTPMLGANGNATSDPLLSDCLRALRMADLVLRLSGTSFLEGNLSTDQRTNAAYTVDDSLDEESQSPAVRTLDAGDVNRHDGLRGVPAVKFAGKAMQPDADLSGYPLTSLVEALDLLAEFRLLDVSLADRLTALIRDWVEKSGEERAARRHCLSTGFRCLHRLANWAGDVVRGGWLLTSHDDLACPDSTDSWPPLTLSPGENQRLVLAAVCHRRPQLVFLDEATSQLNEVDESQGYRSLLARRITTVTVAHRPSVQVYHKWELRLFPCAEETGLEQSESSHARGEVSKSDEAGRNWSLRQLPSSTMNNPLNTCDSNGDFTV